MSKSMSARLLSWLGVLFGLSLAGWFLARLDYAAALKALAHLRPGFLFAVCLCLAGSSLTRALRWRRILVEAGGLGGAAVRRRPLRVWLDVCVGYFGNQVLPARAGEAWRICRLRRWSGASLTLALGTAALDRIFDVFGLALLAGAFLWLETGKRMDSQVPRALALLFMAGLAVCLGGLLARRRAEAWLERAAARSARPGWRRAREGFRTLLEAGLALGRPAAIGALLGFSAWAVLLDSLSCWLLFQAFSWDTPFLGAVSMNLALAAAASLPAAPGYLGAYQAAAALALGPYGVGADAAVVYAFIAQLTAFLTFSALSGAGWLIERFMTGKSDLRDCEGGSGEVA